MITLKKRPRTLPLPQWKPENPQRFLPAIAIATLLVLLLPSLSRFVIDQVQTQAAGGTSCIRVEADRKSQVRKYGSDCD